MSLTAAELAGMRATTEDYLPDTCVIHAGTLTSDSGGGYTTTYTASGTVDCRIAPAGIRGREDETGGRISPDADWIVTLPFDASVTEDNRLVVSGDTYEVVAVRDRSQNLTTRVEVTRRV